MQGQHGTPPKRRYETKLLNFNRHLDGLASIGHATAPAAKFAWRVEDSVVNRSKTATLLAAGARQESNRLA